MRLIDADAEISRIEQEITRINKRIIELGELQEKEPSNRFIDFEKKVESCYLNRMHCISEICALKSYKTAYDVNKVIDQLKEMLCSVEDEVSDIECYARNRHFRDAIEVVEGKG